MIKYILDTNICIYIIKKSPKDVFYKFNKLKVGDIGISSITYCELQYGVSNSKKIKENQKALNGFLAPLDVLDFPGDAAPLYGDTKVKLKKKGTPIGQLDLIIGVHALYLGVTVVSNNVKEFARITNLKVENWA
ncbi:MAG: type II toxin-antitoxin system tRNA(fMet)-specific endonuclease VapC [Candidatus Anammoxibacter sp.]